MDHTPRSAYLDSNEYVPQDSTIPQYKRIWYNMPQKEIPELDDSMSPAQILKVALGHARFTNKDIGGQIFSLLDSHHSDLILADHSPSDITVALMEDLIETVKEEVEEISNSFDDEEEEEVVETSLDDDDDEVITEREEGDDEFEIVDDKVTDEDEEEDPLRNLDEDEDEEEEVPTSTPAE